MTLNGWFSTGCLYYKYGLTEEDWKWLNLSPTLDSGENYMFQQGIWYIFSYQTWVWNCWYCWYCWPLYQYGWPWVSSIQWYILHTYNCDAISVLRGTDSHLTLYIYWREIIKTSIKFIFPVILWFWTIRSASSVMSMIGKFTVFTRDSTVIVRGVLGILISILIFDRYSASVIRYHHQIKRDLHPQRNIQSVFFHSNHTF